MQQISFFYMSLLALMYFILSALVIRLRVKLKISTGHGGNGKLEKMIRAHGNFAEYVPFCLMLLVALEFLQLPNLFLHIMGCSILLGRICHFIGLNYRPAPNLWRISGMSLTFVFMIVAALLILQQIIFIKN